MFGNLWKILPIHYCKNTRGLIVRWLVALEILRIHAYDSRNKKISTVLSGQIQRYSFWLAWMKYEKCFPLLKVLGIHLRSHLLVQIANFDTGEIKFVHGEEVREIVCSYKQEVRKRDESPTSNELQFLRICFWVDLTRASNRFKAVLCSSSS